MACADLAGRVRFEIDGQGVKEKMKKRMWVIGTLTVCTAMVMAFAGCTSQKGNESSSSATAKTTAKTTTTGAMTTASTTGMPTTDGSMATGIGTNGTHGTNGTNGTLMP